MLIVDAAGVIVAKTDNVTVRAGLGGPALNVGDVITGGTTIWIDPIIYDELPTALFEANHVDGVPEPLLEHPRHAGVFYIQETWNSVHDPQLVRHADLLSARPARRASRSTRSTRTYTTPVEAVIDVSVDNGAERSPTRSWTPSTCAHLPGHRRAHREPPRAADDRLRPHDRR